jgi:hypothetical protein
MGWTSKDYVIKADGTEEVMQEQTWSDPAVEAWREGFINPAHAGWHVAISEPDLVVMYHAGGYPTDGQFRICVAVRD